MTYKSGGYIHAIRTFITGENAGLPSYLRVSGLDKAHERM